WALPDKFNFRGFEVKGWVCKKCGEKILDPEDSGRIFAINKLAQKQTLTARIAKVGNSFVFRVPMEIISALNLKDKGQLEVRIADNKRVEFTVPG
ncbi:YgiT-type zinc finger protein, partial [Candidatus Micrarchaeota archaeon]|nr:YgiT-type zinc finger protein [Candidatus Micrarchaeota archaeon]